MSRSAFFASFLAGLVLSGCGVVRAPTAEELRALDHPPAEVAARVEKLLPGALEWHERVEAELLPQGRPLSQAETAAAREMGVSRPERVRVVVLDAFPMPEDRELRAWTERFGMGSSSEGGRTLGYAILLKPRFAESSFVVTHELVHVAQHERMGRIGFVRRYLTELEMMGPRSPLELEAYRMQRRIAP